MNTKIIPVQMPKFDYDYDKVQGKGTACIPDQNTQIYTKRNLEGNK